MARTEHKQDQTWHPKLTIGCMKMKVELEMNGKYKNGEKIVQSVRTEQNIRQFCFLLLLFFSICFLFYMCCC